MRFVDLTNNKYGRLTVLKKLQNHNKHIMWLCKCECGNEIKASGYNLKSGHVKSCGCLKSELSRKRKLTHGLSKTFLYAEWARIRRRCNNPNMTCYKDYGGRGIKVCSEWDSVENFINWSLLNGYKNGLSIDRIDNNKGYSPDNCRWVTRKVQANNKRNNHLITYNGETKTLAQWSEHLNLPYGVLKYRINNNWNTEKAFFSPVEKKYSHKK